jgi:uncharacterized protein (TIGR02444 family)
MLAPLGSAQGCRQHRDGNQEMSDDSTELAASLRSRLAEFPLRDFAFQFYARPGVEPICLKLQDEGGVDVCELLWRCWLFHHGLCLPDAPKGLDGIRRWQLEITAPLRRLRRELKVEARHGTGVAALRQTLKEAELQAEEESLRRLQSLTLRARPEALPSPRPRLTDYLAEALQLHETTHLSDLDSLRVSLDPSSSAR